MNSGTMMLRGDAAFANGYNRIRIAYCVRCMRTALEAGTSRRSVG